MIETTGKVEYSKAKTIPCDGDEEDDENGTFFSLKYKETLDIDNADSDARDHLNKEKEHLSGESEQLDDCSKSVKKKNRARKLSICEHKDDGIYGADINEDLSFNDSFNAVSKSRNKGINGSKKMEFSKEDTSNGNISKKEDEKYDKGCSGIGKMYHRNVASTKYYDKSSDSSSEKNVKESIPVTSGNASNNDKEKDSLEILKNSETFFTDANEIMEEKKTFERYIEDDNKNRENTTISSNHCEEEPHHMITWKNSDQGKSNEKNLTKDHSPGDMNTSIRGFSKTVSLHHTNECKMADDVVVVAKGDDAICDELSECSGKKVKKEKNYKMEKCYDTSGKDLLCTKKEDFKSLSNNQDIFNFNEEESINDSTTECTSVRDMPKYRVHFSPASHELKLNETCDSKDLGNHVNLKGINIIHNEDFSTHEGDMHSKKKTIEMSKDLEHCSAESTSTSFLGVTKERESDYKSTAVGVHGMEMMKEPSLSSNHIVMSNDVQVSSNSTPLEKTCVVNDKKGKYVGNGCADHRSGDNRNKRHNNNLYCGAGDRRDDSLSVSGIAEREGNPSEETFYKKKNFYMNKEKDNLKKKNDTTLKKSEMNECTKNEKGEESIEAYFRSSIPENIMKNVKYENPSNTFNDIINNSGDYDLTAQLRSNNSVHYSSARGKEKGCERREEVTKVSTRGNASVNSHTGRNNPHSGVNSRASVNARTSARSEKADVFQESHMVHKSKNNSKNSYRGITSGSPYNNEKDYVGARNTRMYHEVESNNAQGKKYYLLPSRKSDVNKENKNQMLMISKQKIKKIWNKFKNGSPKEQNIVPTFESEKNLFPGGEAFNAHHHNHPHNHVEGGGSGSGRGSGGGGSGGGSSLGHGPFKECISKPIRWINSTGEKSTKAKCIFNWKIAQKSLFKMLQSAHNFSFNGVKYYDWKLTCIPTLGFSKSSNRVQEMYKAVVPSKDRNVRNDIKLFIKKIPVYIWVKQFNLMNEYEGEYVTDGENFVMEATSLAFLNEYHPGITPKLYKILYEPENKNMNDCNTNVIPPKSMFNNLTVFNDVLMERLKYNISGNIVMVSEFFSEDILDFIDRRQKNYNMKISNNEKSYILYQCLKLLIRLHDAGLSHLDLTPENILISDNYEMRLCDLSKSTPIYTYNLRHVKDINRLYLFESCEPTIAKGAYMPPECWKIYWKYDTMKIKNPLKELQSITDQEKRKQFYFDVSSADKFMLGVFFFWIWTNGNLWKFSDPVQDEDFFYFVKSDMNFDKFELTRKWPCELKNIIKVGPFILEERRREREEPLCCTYTKCTHANICAAPIYVQPPYTCTCVHRSQCPSTFRTRHVCLNPFTATVTCGTQEEAKPEGPEHAPVVVVQALILCIYILYVLARVSCAYQSKCALCNYSIINCFHSSVRHGGEGHLWKEVKHTMRSQHVLQEKRCFFPRSHEHACASV
ncbi:serine/threonine protein kinase, FIKK family [Plasmodium ovale wallikeri]|uniref:non-specific serine/threonine protein kinase n=1 Tax=Plasmodium ovale wallikeri TaxID=864142 RepID=A0A1A8YI96_PLAOA|nr:serine/threonine protein kinase, FIKK family [Plasmodium ovale wallikeri]